MQSKTHTPWIHRSNTPPGNPESRSPLKGSRRFFLTLPSGFTPGGGVGTAFPLDPPLDRQGGTGPGAGALCRRPSEVKGGGRRDGRAESRPHRCLRGILGAEGLERRSPPWELQFRHIYSTQAAGEILFPTQGTAVFQRCFCEPRLQGLVEPLL